MPPTAAMRGSDRLEIARAPAARGRWSRPLLVLAAAVGLAQLGPVDGRPLFGYASSFAIIIGASLLVPAIIFGLARLVRRPLRRLLGVEGLLAHANLAAAIPRLSISVAALAVSLSMMVAIAVMIGSFRDTVVYWVGQTLQADLFVGPGVQPTVGSEQTLSPDVIAAVRSASRRRGGRHVPQRRSRLRRQPRRARRRAVRRRAVARRAALQGAGRRPRGAGAGRSAAMP